MKWGSYKYWNDYYIKTKKNWILIHFLTLRKYIYFCKLNDFPMNEKNSFIETEEGFIL